MKRILLLILLLVTGVFAFGQGAPESLAYQGVARNATTGLPLSEQDLGVKVLLKNTINNATVYEEIFSSVTTNKFGLYTLNIGTGTTIGDFSTINWATSAIAVQVSIDPDGGTAYVPVGGAQQLLSVPYALYAKSSGSGGSGGGDPTDELITDIKIQNDKLVITEGANVKDVDLSAYKELPNPVSNGYLFYNNGVWEVKALSGGGTDNQILTVENGNLKILGGNEVPLSELFPQVTSVDNGKVLKVVNGIWAIGDDLNGGSGGTDNQELTLSTDNKLSIEDGNEVDLSPLKELPTTATDGQVLKRVGGLWVAGTDDTGGASAQSLKDVLLKGADANNVVVTGLGDPVNSQDAATKKYVDDEVAGLDVKDGDADAMNEIQDLSKTGDKLKITNNVSATEIDLKEYKELPSYAGLNGKVLTVTGGGLSWNAVSTGGGVDNDNQGLSVVGDSLKISNAKGVHLDALQKSELPTTATDGQVLKRVGGLWVAGTDDVGSGGTTYTAGTGIDLTGNQIKNTGDTNATDDVLTTSNFDGDVSGTYAAIIINSIKGKKISTTTPSVTGQVLTWNQGTNEWTPIKPTEVTSLYTGNGTIPKNTEVSIDNTVNFDGNTFYIDASNDVVGIGKIPIAAAKLDIDGGKNAAAIFAVNTDASKATIYAKNNAAGGGVSLRTEGQVRMEDLGSSTTNLDVVTVNSGGGANGLLKLRTLNSIAFNGIGSITDKTVPVWNNTTQEFQNSSMVVNGGNVGIGTASPSFPLEIRNSNSIRLAYIEAKKPNSTSSKIAVTGIVSEGEGTGQNKGVVGNVINSEGSTNIGVEGSATGGNGDNYGIRAWASGGDKNFAAYFPLGHVYVKDNLGIGTLTPSHPLDIESNGSGNAGAQLNIRQTGIGTSNNHARIRMENASGTDYFILSSSGKKSGDEAAANFNFYYSGTGNLMTIKGDGKVGIGTATPNSRLDVNASTASEDGLRVQINGSLKFVVKNNGGVNIGSNSTNTPANGLHISGELNTSTTGTANMIPIAYGTFSSRGLTLSSSGNIKVTRSSTGTYSIAVAGHSSLGNYIKLVTAEGNTYNTTTTNGQHVYIRDITTGAYNDGQFSIVIYKP